MMIMMSMMIMMIMMSMMNDHDDHDEHDEHDGHGDGNDTEVWARHASLPKNMLCRRKFFKTFTLRELDFWARSGLKVDYFSK